MKERPILFSATMIRALLDGTKTQTRRVVKWRGLEPGLNLQFSGLSVERHGSNYVLTSPTRDSHAYRSIPQPCPYGQPGDRLWVRETFAEHPRFADVAYRADGEEFEDSDGFLWEPKWRPSIHMPRKLSRIVLEVTEVTVQRLEDITDDDAVDEGIRPLPLQESAVLPWWTADVSAGPKLHARTPVAAYGKLWESINGEGSWYTNPWVWCISFRRVTP